MSNIIAPNNPHPPIPYLILYGIADSKPLLTKEEQGRVLEIAAKEADFFQRRSEFNRLNMRHRVRAEAAAYARGEGPEPRQTVEQAQEYGEMMTTQLRISRMEWFKGEPRTFILGIYERMLERAQAAVAKLEKQHAAEAAALGVAYITTPLVWSARRSLGFIEKDHAHLKGDPDSLYLVKQMLLPKLGLQPPAAPAAVEFPSALSTRPSRSGEPCP